LFFSCFLFFCFWLFNDAKITFNLTIPNFKLLIFSVGILINRGENYLLCVARPLLVWFELLNYFVVAVSLKRNSEPNIISIEPNAKNGSLMCILIKNKTKPVIRERRKIIVLKVFILFCFCLFLKLFTYSYTNLFLKCFSL